MDTVFDFLFLRRLKFEYQCPAVCPIFPASGSSQAITGQIISPLTPMPPGGVFGGFLTFGPIIGGLCYGIYQQEGSTFTPLAQCVPPHSFVTCCAGCFKYSVITVTGNGPLSDPVCTDGSTTITIPLPSGDGILGYNIFQNINPLDPGGTYSLVLSGAFENVFQACAPGCYSFTVITTDGETPFQTPFCIPQGGCASTVTLLTDLVGYWPLDEHVGNTQVYNPPAIDFSGNGNNLSETGPTGQSEVGKIDLAYHPQSGFLTHVDNAFLGIGAGESFTINTWIKDKFDTQNNFYVGKWDSTNALMQDYLLFGDAFNGFYSPIALQVRNLVGALIKVTAPDNLRSNASTWHMMTFGYDDATQTIWIQIDNGIKTTTPCVGIRRSAQAFSFADSTQVAYPNPLGVIDETGMWKRSLTPIEVTQLWNSGAGSTYPFA